MKEIKNSFEVATMRFAVNITAIARLKGMKIGDIERYASVAPGYLSRVKKTGRMELSKAIAMACYVDERLDKLYMNDYASFVERDRIVSELEQLRKQKEELENKLAKTEAHLEKSYVVH